MEFFNQEHADLFFGRKKPIDELISQIFNYRFSLLIGISGIGKTSLLNAGVLHQLKKIGWIACLIRPLNDPSQNMKNSLWGQLLKGLAPVEFEFEDVINTIAEVNPDKKTLIIIDQFEDILNNKRSIDKVVNSLSQIYSYKNSNIHILISYRGDVESEIGEIWQKISGATDGLPRFYLNSLSRENAKDILSNSTQNLGIEFDSTETFNRIIDDIEMESLNNNYSGVFPPFIQMTISSIYDVAKNTGIFTVEKYEELEECRGIISNYLYNQLRYLGENEKNGIKILISLVSNYGTKTQKSLDDIVIETQLDSQLTRLLLQKLIDLRLIRNLDNAFEVTHDLLAKNILNSLVTEEEKDIRRFNFLLESKAAAYKSTIGDLTILEHLHLYKYRQRIKTTKETLDLIVSSYIKNSTPVFFWINESSFPLIDNNKITLFNKVETPLILIIMIKYKIQKIDIF